MDCEIFDTGTYAFPRACKTHGCYVGPWGCPEASRNARPVLKEWVIRCRVSGGVTGTREALLKKDGVVQVFTNRALAESRAADLRKNMGRNSLTCFSYTVEEA
jgi:hypothetical protein